MSQPDPKDAATSLREDRVNDRGRAAGASPPTWPDDGGTVTEADAAPTARAGSAPTVRDRVPRRRASSTATARPMADPGQGCRDDAGGRRLEGTDATYTDDPYPNARLEKDGLKLSLDPDALRGSDAMTFGLSGKCIRTAKGQDADFGGQEDLDLQG